MRRRLRWLIALVLLFFAGRFVVQRFLGGPTIATGSYLLLDIRGEYVEAPPDDVLGRLTGAGARSLYHLLAALHAAADDDRIAGIIARIGPLGIGWAKAQDIRDGFAEFRRSDKPLLALLEQEAAGSNLEYYVASAAERIYLSPAATAPLTGLASQFVFLGGVWEKLDVDLTVEKIREYKTMGDMLANKEMTAAHREMANSLLDSIDDQFVGAIAEARRLDAKVVRNLIEECPVSPANYESAGLSDGTKYLEALHEALGGEQTPLIELDEYAEADMSGGFSQPRVAVVYAVGAIVAGESGTTLSGQIVGADTLRDALQEAADDDSVRAVVLRVDSPGGSALASDLIWRATQRVRDKKPLIVSMSDVAGSGGYYIATGADRIVAQPGTLTGSIGVVFARPSVPRLLANLGVNTETITRGKFAYLNDITTPLEREGRAKLVAEMEHIYEQFVDRVSKGRSLSTAEVDEIGRGRAWTGAQAMDNKLVDALGGFYAAIDVAKEAAGIEPEQEVELAFYPEHKPLITRVAELLSGEAAAHLPEPLRQIAHVTALPFRDGGMLTLMPQWIRIR
jgi:protease-4